MDCLFCKIAKHEIPSKIIYENEDLICFYDIHPVAPVHVLIVPKEHFTDIVELSDAGESGNLVMLAVLKAIPHITSICNIKEEGFRLINNCGLNGGQTIMHLHFHLIGGKKLGEKLL